MDSLVSGQPHSWNFWRTSCTHASCVAWVKYQVLSDELLLWFSLYTHISIEKVFMFLAYGCTCLKPLEAPTAQIVASLKQRR